MKPTTLILISLSPFHLFSQEDPEPRVLDVGIQFTRIQAKDAGLPYEDWERLTPGFSNPASTDTAYHSYRNNGYYSNGYIDGQVLFSLKNKLLPNSKLTPLLGFTAGAGNNIYAEKSWEKSTVYPYDTVYTTSTKGGTKVDYVDSAANKWTNYNYYSQQMSVGMMVMFQTNRAKRFSLLFGVSFRYSFSVQSGINVQSGESSDIVSTSDYTSYSSAYYSYPGTKFQDNQVNRNYKGPFSFGYQLAVPVGVDFVMGKKSAFWQKIVVGLQGSVAYRVTGMKGISQNDYGTYAYSLNLKYRL